MGNAVQIPFPVFFDAEGKPLDRGYVYIGISGLNPLDPANKQSVFWDAALTIPAPNPARTGMGYVTYNGKAARPFVAGDYSLIVQDRNGKTVFSSLVNAGLSTDFLMTQSRGSLVRSMRVPPSYNLNLILESGFYSWTNQATTNGPGGLNASDPYILEVLASPDGSGIIIQRIFDLNSNTYYDYSRQSINGGSSWSTWITDLKNHTIVVAAGAMGVLAVINDVTYYLTAATTATLPVTPILGVRYAFKNIGNFTTTITANAGQNIGNSASTTFVLNKREDYVLLEWDGSTTWQIIGENCKWRGEVVHIASGSGNWIVPTGVYKIRVTLIPGGGGGAGYNDAGANKNGGGGGAGTIISTAFATPLDVIPGQSLAYVVGAAGAQGATNADGGNGGDTTFAGVFTASGSVGGKKSVAAGGGSGGASQSNLSVPGGSGQFYTSATTSGGSGGSGGGAGGVGGTNGSIGSDGWVGGGGGGSAYGGAHGGAGGIGRIIIEY